MKAKLSYKSKRNIVISVIIVALLAVIGTGTYFFTKGNDDAQAFADNNTQMGESTQNEQKEELGNIEENSEESKANEEEVQNPIEDEDENIPTNGGTSNPSNQAPSTQGQNGGTTGSTVGEVPNEEYVTERVEEQEVLVSQDYAVKWAPLNIEATTTTSNLSIVRRSTTYLVEYYYEQNGNYATTTDLKEERTATIDTITTVIKEDKISQKEGYTFDSKYAGNKLEGVVKGDGSLVLKVYFKQQYTVTYKPGTQGTFTEQKIENINHGDATPEFEGEKTGKPGFNFSDWDKVVTDTVTEDATYIALWEGLDVVKERTKIEDKDNLGNITFVDQAEDIIYYTITVTNIGDVKAKNITLTDDHKVEVASIKVGDTEVDIENRQTNTFDAGKDLLKGVTTQINPGESICVTVKYTVSQKELDNALKQEDKTIVNTAVAKLNDHEYEDSENTDVKQRCEYTVKYYFNGKQDETIKKDIHSATIEGATIGFEKPNTLGGYTYIEYVGIDEAKNGSTTAKDGENIIKVYYGKSETAIDKDATETVKAGEDIDYKVTVSNTGYLGTTITVTDELVKTTYVPNSAKVGDTLVEPTITTNEAGNKVLSWEIKLDAASKEHPTVSKVITFKVTTAKDAFGEKIDNTAKIEGTDKQDTVTTKIKEVNVKYNEFKEGQKGTDLNIIFVLDNSQSMNDPVEGKSYVNTNAKAPIAPSDVSKTRLANAKKAINDFIKAQNAIKTTDMSLVVFNNKNSGIISADRDADCETLMELDESQIITEKGKKYVMIDGVKYRVKNKQKASDGKEYYGVFLPLEYGARLIGTNATSNNDLIAKVNNIAISSIRKGFETCIAPAFDLITNNSKTFISSTKKNVVIVLTDGAFTDKAPGYTAQLQKLRSQVDEIYCIGFGSGKEYDEAALVAMSSNNKCYKAADAGSLLTQFNEILEEATGEEQERTTVDGKVTFNEATNAIKVSATCPIEATYETKEIGKDGKPVMATLFSSTSTVELAEKYGLTIVNNKIISWDIKKFLEKNPNAIVPETTYIKYYIPRAKN